MMMNDENPRDDRNEDFDAESYWKNMNRDDEGDGTSPPEEYWFSLSDHGRGHSGEPGYGPVPEEYRSTGMSKAAMVCGVVSLLSVLFGSSVFFGALGLTFAFLSRGRKMSRQARTGAILSGVGIGAFGVMLAVSLYLLVSTGVWDYMIAEISRTNPGDPQAVTEIQENVLQKLRESLLAEYYGEEAAENSGGTGGAPETAGNTGATGDAPETAGSSGATGAEGGSAGGGETIPSGPLTISFRPGNADDASAGTARGTASEGSAL